MTNPKAKKETSLKKWTVKNLFFKKSVEASQKKPVYNKSQPRGIQHSRSLDFLPRTDPFLPPPSPNSKSTGKGEVIIRPVPKPKSHPTENDKQRQTFSTFVPRTEVEKLSPHKQPPPNPNILRSGIRVHRIKSAPALPFAPRFEEPIVLPQIAFSQKLPNDYNLFADSEPTDYEEELMKLKFVPPQEIPTPEPPKLAQSQRCLAPDPIAMLTGSSKCVFLQKGGQRPLLPERASTMFNLGENRPKLEAKLIRFSSKSAFSKIPIVGLSAET